MEFGKFSAERGAGALMLLSAFLYSLVPVCVGFGDAGRFPFFFTAIAHIAAIPWVFAYIHRSSGGKFINWDIVKTALGYPGNLKFWMYLFLLGVCTTSYAFFSMASEAMASEAPDDSNLPIVAAIYEAWPVLVIVAILIWPHLGEKDTSRDFGFGDWVTLGTALVGLGFVISAREGASLMSMISDLSFDKWRGISLAFVSSLFAAGIVVLTLGHGRELFASKREFFDSEFGLGSSQKVVINCTLLIVVFMHIAGFAISLLLGLVTEEPAPGWNGWGFAAGMGMVIGFGAISFRAASVKSKNPAITALSFFTPLFALAILAALSLWYSSVGDFSSIRWDYLAMGATAIFSTNLLLNLRADLRTGYRSLVLCLWIFGAIRYLYDGLPWNLYYEAIAVVTGILAITVGFRSERFVRRSEIEESLSIDVLHVLTWMIDKHGVEVSGAMVGVSEDMESARKKFIEAHSPVKAKTMGESERKAHTEMEKILRELLKRGSLSEEDQGKISECLKKADKLILSRSHGNNFGEKVAIFGLALASAAISLFLRNEPSVNSPGLMGVDALVGNFFSILVGPVVIFLYFHVVDLERDRSRGIYDEKRLVEAGDLLIVREIHDRAGEKFIAGMILFVTFAIYTVLFFVKHL